ncbi:MAG: ATP-binding protein [Piscirickettsiaceae bacterium]|nr:MAG: ATP-binding protein [Piscirickettsiaceae bacterium]PCI70958.1 MAG: ATP-binding protein [Piscirickettsiaceae bacterium]
MSRFLPKSTESAPQENFKSLLLLRGLSLFGQVLAIILVVYYVELSLPVLSLGYILVVNIIWTLVSFLILKGRANIADHLFFIQLIFDVATLTAVLYLTGGATNPFAWFLLVPHSIASTLLPRLYAWLMALVTSASYTAIVFFYEPLMHRDHPMEMGMDGHFQEHIIGMWLGFVLSAFLMAYFVAGMAESLRKRNKLLADMKDKMFRDERLVALGTLATGAAHELGTPLGTVDIIAHELEQHFKAPEHEAVRSKLALIQQQVKRCKASLANITETASQQRHDAGQVMAVDDYIQGLIMQWQVSHPDVLLQQQWLGQGDVPNILSDLSLSHSIINVLDNAAQASASQIMLTVSWDDDFVRIVIEDEGPGMSEEQLAALGKSVHSPTSAGLGLGTYIAKASVERIGGNIDWKNGDIKGLHVTVCLPLYKQEC